MIRSFESFASAESWRWPTGFCVTKGRSPSFFLESVTEISLQVLVDFVVQCYDPSLCFNLDDSSSCLLLSFSNLWLISGEYFSWWNID